MSDKAKKSKGRMTVAVPLTMEAELAVRLKQYAARNDMSVSRAVRGFIRQHLCEKKAA